MIVAASLLFVSWVTVLGPTLHDGSRQLARAGHRPGLPGRRRDRADDGDRRLRAQRPGRAGGHRPHRPRLRVPSPWPTACSSTRPCDRTWCRTCPTSPGWPATCSSRSARCTPAATRRRASASSRRDARATARSLSCCPTSRWRWCSRCASREAVMSDPDRRRRRRVLDRRRRSSCCCSSARASSSSRTRSLTRSLAGSNEQLQYQLLHDDLTGLPNRPLLPRSAARCRWPAWTAPDELVAVMFVDLDLFKQANDTYGHEAGDEVLITVGRRACAARCGRATPWPASAATSSWCCARTFRVADEANHLAERVVEAITAPMRASARGHRSRCRPASAWSSVDDPLEPARGGRRAGRRAPCTGPSTRAGPGSRWSTDRRARRPRPARQPTIGAQPVIAKQRSSRRPRA